MLKILTASLAVAYVTAQDNTTDADTGCGATNCDSCLESDKCGWYTSKILDSKCGEKGSDDLVDNAYTETDTCEPCSYTTCGGCLEDSNCAWHVQEIFGVDSILGGCKPVSEEPAKTFKKVKKCVEACERLESCKECQKNKDCGWYQNKASDSLDGECNFATDPDFVTGSSMMELQTDCPECAANTCGLCDDAGVGCKWFATKITGTPAKCRKENPADMLMEEIEICEESGASAHTISFSLLVALAALLA